MTSALIFVDSDLVVFEYGLHVGDGASLIVNAHEALAYGQSGVQDGVRIAPRRPTGAGYLVALEWRIFRARIGEAILFSRREHDFSVSWHGRGNGRAGERRLVILAAEKRHCLVAANFTAAFHAVDGLKVPIVIVGAVLSAVVGRSEPGCVVARYFSRRAFSDVHAAYFKAKVPAVDFSSAFGA